LDIRWNKFRGNPITSSSSETGLIPIPLRSRRAAGRDKCRVSGKVNPNTTLYANAYDAGFAYSGKAGLRTNW